MNKILSVGDRSRVLGSDQVIEAMFTTISCRLEPRGKGTRFPAVMEDLYSGYLPPGRAPDALRELREIEAAFREIQISQVVWSLQDLRIRDDHHQPVRHRATNALEYFVDADGRPMISRLQDSVQECLSSSQVLRLAFATEPRDGLLGGLFFVAFGIAWLLLGRAFLRDWSVASSYNFRAGIPIWTFGMDFVILGVAILIAAMLPGVRDWFRRRPLALIAVAITAVIGWLVVCARAGFIPD